jgi:hypothetical protein
MPCHDPDITISWSIIFLNKVLPGCTGMSFKVGSTTSKITWTNFGADWDPAKILNMDLEPGSSVVRPTQNFLHVRIWIRKFI